MTSKINTWNWAVSVGLLVAIVLAALLLLKQLLSPPDMQPSAVGRSIADFTLPDVRGRSVNLKEYAAGRPVVVSFGTTNCPYCILQLSAFKQLKEQYGDQVALLEINIGEDPETVAAHVERLDSPVTTLVDVDAQVYRRYGTGAVPVTVVADATGRIVEIGNYIPLKYLVELLGLSPATQPTAASRVGDRESETASQLHQTGTTEAGDRQLSLLRGDQLRGQRLG